MKKTIKVTGYTLLTIAICVAIFIQLQKNKASNAETAKLANIQGDYYPVRILPVEPTNLVTNISTTGFLESTTDLIVLSETQGTIKVINKEKGDFIKAGQVIAKVDDELLKAQYEAAKASYEQLQRDVERYSKLYVENAVTNQSLEQIKLNMESAKAQYIAAKRQLADSEIKAPIDGFIEDDFIKLGQFIGGGAQICNIIDIKNLKLNISVSEYDYTYLHTGQAVAISSNIYPELKFEGHISYIGKKAGYGNTFDVEVKVNNAENKLNAGMFVTANVADEHQHESIYIPRRAINGSLKNASVFVINGELAELKKVLTGNTQNDQVQIVEGLESGDKLVVEGNYNLFNGAKIKVME